MNRLEGEFVVEGEEEEGEGTGIVQQQDEAEMVELIKKHAPPSDPLAPTVDPLLVKESKQEKVRNIETAEMRRLELDAKREERAAKLEAKKLEAEIKKAKSTQKFADTMSHHMKERQEKNKHKWQFEEPNSQDITEKDELYRIYYRFFTELGVKGSGGARPKPSTIALENLKMEVELQKQQMADERCRGALKGTLDALVGVIEDVAPLVGRNLSHPESLTDNWNKFTQTRECQRTMLELEIKYAGWFHTGPEMYIAMNLAKLAYSVSENNRMLLQSGPVPTATTTEEREPSDYEERLLRKNKELEDEIDSL